MAPVGGGRVVRVEAPLEEEVTTTATRVALVYEPETNRYSGHALVRGDVVVDKHGQLYSLDRANGFMLTVTELREYKGVLERGNVDRSFSVDPGVRQGHYRYTELFPEGWNVFDEKRAPYKPAPTLPPHHFECTGCGKVEPFRKGMAVFDYGRDPSRLTVAANLCEDCFASRAKGYPKFEWMGRWDPTTVVAKTNPPLRGVNLGERLLELHGGQASALYSLGSRLVAGKAIPVDDEYLDAAIWELKKFIRTADEGQALFDARQLLEIVQHMTRRDNPAGVDGAVVFVGPHPRVRIPRAELERFAASVGAALEMDDDDVAWIVNITPQGYASAWDGSAFETDSGRFREVGGRIGLGLRELGQLEDQATAIYSRRENPAKTGTPLEITIPGLGERWFQVHSETWPDYLDPSVARELTLLDANSVVHRLEVKKDGTWSLHKATTLGPRLVVRGTPPDVVTLPNAARTYEEITAQSEEALEAGRRAYAAGVPLAHQYTLPQGGMPPWASRSKRFAADFRAWWGRGWWEAWNAANRAATARNPLEGGRVEHDNPSGAPYFLTSLRVQCPSCRADVAAAIPLVEYGRLPKAGTIDITPFVIFAYHKDETGDRPWDAPWCPKSGQLIHPARAGAAPKTNPKPLPRGGQVRLERGDFGTYLLVDEDTGKDLLIQTDWDYPGVASNLGWSPACTCGGSDGTVNCKACGVTASQMIQSAGEFLDEHLGDTFEDPGYFTAENPLPRGPEGLPIVTKDQLARMKKLGYASRGEDGIWRILDLDPETGATVSTPFVILDAALKKRGGPTYDDTVQAVAVVIEGAGFGAMAQDFIDRPADRARIVRTVAQWMRKGHLAKHADRLEQLGLAVAEKRIANPRTREWVSAWGDRCLTCRHGKITHPGGQCSIPDCSCRAFVYDKAFMEGGQRAPKSRELPAPPSPAPGTFAACMECGSGADVRVAGGRALCPSCAVEQWSTGNYRTTEDQNAAGVAAYKGVHKGKWAEWKKLPLGQPRAPNPRPPKLALGDTSVDTWFERDRQHVELKNDKNDKTIIEWWDEDVSQAVEDGFLDPRDYHASAYNYAVDLGLITGEQQPTRGRGYARNPSLMLVTGNPPREAVLEAWRRFHQAEQFTGKWEEIPDIAGVPDVMFALGRCVEIDVGNGLQELKGGKAWLACNPDDQALWIVSRVAMNLAGAQGAEVRAIVYEPPASSGKDPAHYKHDFSKPRPVLAPVGTANRCRGVLLEGGVYRVDDWIYE